MVFRSSTSSPPAASRRRRAFTLIEVLVASGVTVLLVGFIVVIVSNVSNFWTRSSGSLTAGSQARYALDQLTLDLQSALYRDDGNVWMAANILDATTNATGLWSVATTAGNAKPIGANGSLLLSNDFIVDSRFGLAGTWLRFFTTRRGSNTGTSQVTLVNTVSSPVAVGYQIVRRRTSAAGTNFNTAYFLHRAEARPALIGVRPGVLESSYTITAPAYSTSIAGNNNGSVTGDPRSMRVPGSATNLDSIVADNVIDFGFRGYVRDASQPSGLRIIFPALAVVGSTDLVTLRPGYSANFPKPTSLLSSLPSSSPITALNYDTLFPEVADVMIRVLTDEGARLIATFEAGRLTAPTGRSNAQYWWDLALANSKVYSRRIVLRAEPL